jgi:hypothetical protein
LPPNPWYIFFQFPLIYHGADTPPPQHTNPKKSLTKKFTPKNPTTTKGGELAPEDTRLLTQQGGALVLDGRQTLYRCVLFVEVLFVEWCFVAVYGLS